MPQHSKLEFDRSERRRIYEYVERNGAVDPEKVRKNVLVRPESASKPTRSGQDLDPSVKMSAQAFNHHVSILKRDGYLEEIDGKLRVALPMDANAVSVQLDDVEAVVRPARQEDITGIIGVIRTVAGKTDHAVAARLADKIDRDQVLLRHNEDESRVFFVATVEDDAVGWIHVEALNYPYMDHTAELTVGVLEEYRNQGLGHALLERGLDWAGQQGFLKVYQNVPATNERGIDFLLDSGWYEESRRDGQYLLEGKLVDEVQLATWIDEDAKREALGER